MNSFLRMLDTALSPGYNSFFLDVRLIIYFKPTELMINLCLFPYQADKFHMYVTYCRNKPDSSLLIQQHGVAFFEVFFKHHKHQLNNLILANSLVG